jgi:hypothetical protein
MSTRACIKIKERIKLNDNDKRAKECIITLYHHWDGYPSGVGRDLKKYLNEVVSKWACGWIAEYIATKLVRGCIKDSDFQLALQQTFQSSKYVLSSFENSNNIAYWLRNDKFIDESFYHEPCKLILILTVQLSACMFRNKCRIFLIIEGKA